ncbi:MAG: hypothetical protein ACK57C_01325 [Bacteroidota bacterium]
MKQKLIFFSILWSLASVISYSGNAQGCSDAGFCTINSFKPELASDSAKNWKSHVKIGGFWGSADNSISVYGSYVELYRQISEKLAVDAKITTLGQSGNDIAAFSVGDLFLNLNYRLTSQVQLTVGTKIPFSQANQSSNNLPLPMDYQSSLGTFDLILGLGYSLNKLQLVAAIQQPLSQNKNQFLSSAYPINAPLRKFQSTNQFTRKGDVLLRIAYPVVLHSKIKMTASLLPIYHLGNDQFRDELNRLTDIQGSKGLTLNGNLFFDYAFNATNSLQLSLGAPFVVRDVRPDGLTRGFILNLEYKIKF